VVADIVVTGQALVFLGTAGVMARVASAAAAVGWGGVQAPETRLFVAASAGWRPGDAAWAVRSVAVAARVAHPSVSRSALRCVTIPARLLCGEPLVLVVTAVARAMASWGGAVFLCVTARALFGDLPTVGLVAVLARAVTLAGLAEYPGVTAGAVLHEGRWAMWKATMAVSALAVTREAGRLRDVARVAYRAQVGRVLGEHEVVRCVALAASDALVKGGFGACLLVAASAVSDPCGSGIWVRIVATGAISHATLPWVVR